MRRALTFAALSLAACAFLAPAAAAQAPKPGKPYVEASEYGFQVNVPDDWEPVPPDPNEGNTIIKFDPKSVKYVIVDAKSARPTQLDLHVWIARFEKNAPKRAKGDIKVRSKDIGSYVKREIFPGATEVSKKTLQVNKLPATEYEYSGTIGEDEVRVYAVVYELSADLDIAWIGIGVGGKKWPKWEQPFQQMAKSFKTIAVKAGPEALAEGSSYRDKRRAELQADMAKLGGVWKLYETPRYFIISNNEDKAFLDELKSRLEAIRDVYEKDYPYEKMQEIKAAAAQARTGDGKEKDPKKEAEKAAEKAFDEAVNGGIDPREASKCSIVRVCKSKEEYMSYGGPGGSAGYWSPSAKELVLYDDKAEGGRGDTWAVLNHEGFHQYIYYLYGKLSPHSWYNEGTGDYYSGFQRGTNGQFKLEKFSWRKDLIAGKVREGKTVPLKEFTKLTQQEYYGKLDKYGTDIGVHYAQGWSLIYFLRTGKEKHAKGWNPAWETILDTYFKVLGATEDLEQAVNQAFDGVDWAALEQAWKDYTR